jgi:hypothetical protein
MQPAIKMRIIMAKLSQTIGFHHLSEFPRGCVVVTELENGKTFRSTLIDPEEGIATVWPVEPGQEDSSEPGLIRLEAVSKMGSKVLEEETRPRVVPVEAAEGPVMWGLLLPRHELVFQNERDGAGTFTYTGSAIVKAYFNMPRTTGLRF